MELVKGVTSDHDLIALAKQIGVHLDNIIMSSEIPNSGIPKKGSFLVLLRPEDRDVGHWTAVHNGLYYDSMGEGPPRAYRIRKYNHIQYQGARDEYCGIFCLLWLYSRQKNEPSLLKNFHDLNLTVI